MAQYSMKIWGAMLFDIPKKDAILIPETHP
jgi:hypothetical protein